ncbi:polysaccharide biosynthesis protein [Planctomycetota bacterium]
MNRLKLADRLIANRVPILFVAHLVVFAVAYRVAFVLRFDFDMPVQHQQAFWRSLPLLLLIKLGVFLALKSFHGWWRYVTFEDMVSIARASFLAFLLVAVVDHFILPFQIPRAVLILDLMVATAMLGLTRSSWRLVREGIWPGVRLTKGCKPALIISNCHETVVLAHQINSRLNTSYRIVGILSDDERKIGSSRAGIPIIGTPSEAAKFALRYDTDEVWIVAGEVPGKRLRELKDSYDEHDISIKVIPPSLDSDQASGQIPVRDIEINDLLRRDPVALDFDKIGDELHGARILVTGAGGSIGSEICRQIIKFKPSEIVLVDHRENSVFLIHNELTTLKADETTLHPAVGDILDEPRMRSLFEAHRPEFVYHAAAHKHVGLMEINPGESIKNNVFGTKNIAELAHEFEARKFVLISTDKAVNPTSVMGCTKQIAERVVHSMAQNSDTAFVVVRFGNVLGSNGSVVPIFKEQIARGGPITITDERMTRFFMSIPEASQLVLQAVNMGKGGEIFVLDMGEQLPIIDLAREMIKLAGLPPDSIEIETIGSRPGEKLYEELYFDDEKTIDTLHSKIHAAYHRTYDAAEINATIDVLRRAATESDLVIRGELKRLVPDYRWPAAELVTDTSKAST